MLRTLHLLSGLALGRVVRHQADVRAVRNEPEPRNAIDANACEEDDAFPEDVLAPTAGAGMHRIEREIGDLGGREGEAQ